MNTKHLLVAAGVLALASCAAVHEMGVAVPRAHGKPGIDHCSNATCTVDVVIDTSSKPCKITSPHKRDGLSVKSGSVPGLVWQITGSAYVFDPQKPIEFRNSPSGTFTNPSVNGNRFSAQDNNNHVDHKGVHPYWINVQSPDGSDKCQLDPYIVNE